MANGDASAKRILAGEETLRITPSGEDGIAQIRALLGLENLVTNVNLPNIGQIANLAKGHVVETNALFRRDSVEPVFTGNMPAQPRAWTLPHLKAHRYLLEAFDQKSLEPARLALRNDPSVKHLGILEIDRMFDAIASKIQPALAYYKH